MGRGRNRRKRLKQQFTAQEQNIVKAVQKQFNTGTTSAQVTKDIVAKHVGAGSNSTVVGTTTYRRGACHLGPKVVMQIGKANIYGASLSQVEDDWNWALMIRFSDYGSYKDPDNIIANEQAQAILPKELLVVTVPPILDIKWPDYGTPTFKKAWWKLLYDTLKKMPEKSNVVIHCQGGHGRTGTALSILAALNGQKEPIKFVRSNYCSEVVESNGQITYIEEMTGLKLTDSPVTSWFGYGGYTHKAQTAAQTPAAQKNLAPADDQSHEDYAYTTPDGISWYWDDKCECFLEYSVWKDRQEDKVIEIEYTPEDK